MEQLTGNTLASLWNWVGEELESREHENLLNVVLNPTNGEMYLAVQSSWFQGLVLESLEAVHDCYVQRVNFEGNVVVLGDLTILLQSEDVEKYKFYSQKRARQFHQSLHSTNMGLKSYLETESTACSSYSRSTFFNCLPHNGFAIPSYC